MKYRFGLRAGMGAVFAFSILVALVAREMREFNRYARQHEAATALLEIGSNPDFTDHSQSIRGNVYSLFGADMQVLTEIQLRPDLSKNDRRRLSALGDCFALATLNCSGCPIDDADVELLAQAPAIGSLYLSNTQVTATGLKKLARLRGLQVLAFHDREISVDFAAALKLLPKLRVLDVSRTTITGPAAARIAEIAGLEELNCGEATLSDAAVAEFAKLPALQVLRLSGTTITGDGLRPFARSRFLADLDLSSHSIPWTEFLEIDAAHEVVPLNVEGLAGNTSIERLELHGRALAPASVAALGSLGGLRELGLIDSDADDRTLQNLTGHRRLSTLLLAGTKISDDGLRFCRSLPALKKLSLSRTSITNQSLVNLNPAAGLEELDLVKTQVTASGLLVLKGHSSLRQVYVDPSMEEESSLSVIKTAEFGFRVESLSVLPHGTLGVLLNPKGSSAAAD